MSVVPFRAPANSPFARLATLTAILNDTLDLLKSLTLSDEAAKVAVEAQVEAITEILGT